MLLQLCEPVPDLIGRLLELSDLVGNSIHLHLVDCSLLFKEDKGSVGTGDTIGREENG